MKKHFILVLTISFFNFYGQTKKERYKTFLSDSLSYNKIVLDPLRPAKAAFYSAVLPGLGQAYNKKYWKIPIIYGAMGTSIYFYIDNQKKYNYYRDEYKRRLEGFNSNDVYLGKLTDTQLITAQKQFQKNRDLSALFIIGFYVLNIIDANVDASLSNFNLDNSLSIKPSSGEYNTLVASNVGLSVVYYF